MSSSLYQLFILRGFRAGIGIFTKNSALGRNLQNVLTLVPCFQPGGYEPGWKPRWSGRVSERAPVWGAAWGSGQSPRHSEPQVGTGGTGTQVLGDNGVERESSSSGLLQRGRPQHPAALSLRRSPTTDPFSSESLSLSLSLSL